MSATCTVPDMTGSHLLPNLPTYIPPFVDIDMVLVDVADDGVSTGNPDDVEGLRQVVAQAEAQGIDLKVVVVNENPFIIDTPLRDVATAVGQANPGSTVVVLSPNFVGTYSTDFDRATLEAGQDVAKTGGSVEKAQNFLNVIRTPDFPWTAMTIVLIFATVVAVIVTRLLQLRSKATPERPNREQPVETLD